MKGNKYFYLFILFLLGCSGKELEPLEYVNWVKDLKNGLHKQKQVGEYVFDVQYKPTDYVLLSDEEILKEDKNALENKRAELDSLYHFTLRITKQGSDLIKGEVSHQSELQQNMYYYSFDFSKDIRLIEGEEEKPCALYHFERSYDLSQQKSFVLAFPKSNEVSDKTLVIDSRELGIGIVKIKINKEDLERLPQLKI